MKRFTLGLFSLLATSCGLEDANYQTSRPASASMAITNAEEESNVLRAGTSLSLATTPELKLKANSLYRVVVRNISTGSEVAKADLLSDMKGIIGLTNVAHDVGEFDDVQERHSLSVTVAEADGPQMAELVIPITPHMVHFQGHGFSVEEVQPPHVFGADSSGKSLNAFVVGGAPDPGEVAAPIYVKGNGFPDSVSKVDIYVVRDRDKWQGAKIPQPGSADYVFGPVVGSVARGLLQATSLGWAPTGKDIGAFDILVDVDQNGVFDFSFSSKDGADGEGKVGLTIQYGAAWFRAKAALEEKHLLVNLAYNSSSRSGGAWVNSYGRTSPVYSYINPPVQHGERHAFVTKLVVYHQSWSGFWNNPERMTQSAYGSSIPIGNIVVQATGGTTQHSCTNSPPVAIINPEALPFDQTGVMKFDVVYDYDNDGRYDVGRDLLDVVAHRTDGSLVSAKDLTAMPDAEVFGFQVTK